MPLVVTCSEPGFASIATRRSLPCGWRSGWVLDYQQPATCVLYLQDLLEFTKACPSLSVGETGAREQLVQVALHILTQHTMGTTLTSHMLLSHR